MTSSFKPKSPNQLRHGESVPRIKIEQPNEKASLNDDTMSMRSSNKSSKSRQRLNVFIDMFNNIKEKVARKEERHK